VVAVSLDRGKVPQCPGTGTKFSGRMFRNTHSKTVMHEMMFKAARMIKHAERWFPGLGLGQNDSGFAVFERHYTQLRATWRNKQPTTLTSVVSVAIRQVEPWAE